MCELQTGAMENFLQGSWKSPGFLFSKRVGTPVPVAIVVEAVVVVVDVIMKLMTS